MVWRLSRGLRKIFSLGGLGRGLGTAETLRASEAASAETMALLYMSKSCDCGICEFVCLSQDTPVLLGGLLCGRDGSYTMAFVFT